MFANAVGRSTCRLRLFLANLFFVVTGVHVVCPLGRTVVCIREGQYDGQLRYFAALSYRKKYLKFFGKEDRGSGKGENTLLQQRVFPFLRFPPPLSKETFGVLLSSGVGVLG